MRTLLLTLAAFMWVDYGVGCACYYPPYPYAYPSVDPADTTLTVANDSSSVLYELRVTQVNGQDWGNNLLPSALYPGDRLTVALVCDSYWVLFRDQRGVDCVIGPIDLCFSNEYWSIDNATLRSCAFQ